MEISSFTTFMHHDCDTSYILSIRDYQSTRRPCNPRFVSLFEGPNPFLSVQTSVFDVPLIQTEPSGKKRGFCTLRFIVK